jgi:predicted ATPase/DNA-binding SARP family transcriptional activator/DNA-binding CsgD family transcriptional regulator
VGSRNVDQNAWRLKKAASLVKLLALAPGHRLHREQAMNLLWPDSNRSAAANSLHKALHAARRTFDLDAGSRYLVSVEDLLVLCPNSDLWVDVEAFEEAAAAARRAKEPAAYRVAVELYAGTLLPEDRYEEWAENRREELQRSFLSLLVELAGIHEQRGEYGPAVEILRRAIAEDPILEEAHAGLMRLYALSGRRRDALQQYERLREVLSRELFAELDATTRQFREDIAAGRFPPVQRANLPQGELPEAGKHNLPARRTSFVGREREIVEIKRSLAMTRLLTLTGVGGSGKTRLAVEVARDLVGAFPDGVWLVELAPLSDPDLVSQAIAQTLGVRESPGQPLIDTVVEALRPKNMLLILDNCEHLVEAAARVVDTLLAGCPKVRILAASREALSVVGEVGWPVPAFPVPDLESSFTVAELESFESARLFAERASEKRPGFALVPENVQPIAEICRRLEGMPLAIELAAARVRALSVGELSERLADSLKVLTGGARTQTPRQRSLKGTLDWSHDLLSGAERVLFRRLSVFAGGWTLEASEAVGSGEDVEEGEILDLLSGLVDKSLVAAEPTAGGGVRYRMLEPVRQYALEKLRQDGEVEEVRRRHAAFFLALAEDAEPQLRGPEDVGWLERLEVEHDNIRATLTWSIEHSEGEIGLRLAAALWRFWDTKGHNGEGRGWLVETLAMDGRTPVPVRAKALEGLGWMAYFQGDMAQAAAAAEEGLELGVRAEIGDNLASTLRIILGFTAEMQGDFERATELHEEALALSREAADRRAIADSLLGLGGVWSMRGDSKRAIELFEEGIVVAREAGDAVILAGLLLSLGYELLLAGDYDRGEALNEEAAALYLERGYKSGLEFALDNLGWAALLRGDRQEAKVKYRESLVLCQEVGDQLITVESLDGLACVSVAEGQTIRAAKLFGAAQALRETVSRRLEPRERALREPHLVVARSRLDEATWEAAWAEGRAMSMEQAIEYALLEEKPTSPTSPTPKRPSTDESPLLTRREKEVAALVARGLSNREIAQEFHLSERTVHAHLRTILKKLGLRSREQVASRLTSR